MKDGELITVPDGRGIFYVYSKEDLLWIITEQLKKNEARCFNVIELPYLLTSSTEDVRCSGNGLLTSPGPGDRSKCNVQCYYPYFDMKDDCNNCSGFFLL